VEWGQAGHYVTLRFAGAVDIRFSCFAQSLQADVNRVGIARFISGLRVRGWHEHES
jgi:hypothetical protein